MNLPPNGGQCGADESEVRVSISPDQSRKSSLSVNGRLSNGNEVAELVSALKGLVEDGTDDLSATVRISGDRFPNLYFSSSFPHPIAIMWTFL